MNFAENQDYAKKRAQTDTYTCINPDCEQGLSQYTDKGQLSIRCCEECGHRLRVVRFGLVKV